MQWFINALLCYIMQCEFLFRVIFSVIKTRHNLFINIMEYLYSISTMKKCSFNKFFTQTYSVELCLFKYEFQSFNTKIIKNCIKMFKFIWMYARWVIDFFNIFWFFFNFRVFKFINFIFSLIFHKIMIILRGGLFDPEFFSYK